MADSPGTEAGRTFLEILDVLDALAVPPEPPVDWAHGIVQVEREARAAALAAGHLVASFPDCDCDAAVDAVLAILDDLSGDRT